MSQYSDAVVADSPVAYWRLGESAGSTASPTVGANNGTYNGVALAQPGLFLTDPATSVYFDGASDYITTPGQCGVSGPPLTIEMWIKPDQDAVIGLFDSAPNQMNCIRNYDGDRIEWWSISPYIIYNFLKGTRYHVVLTCTIDAGYRRMKLYINGSLNANVTGANSGTAVTAWRFGDINQGAAGRYKGWMQELALYNKELSSTRVGVHFATGNINVVFRQAVPLEIPGSIASHKLIPLWADGEKSFVSAPFAPQVEFFGRVYNVSDLPFEAVAQYWVTGIDDVPVSVDLGWLAPVDTLPFGAAGWLFKHRKSPFEARGLTDLLHSWNVLRTTQSVVSHSWNVAKTVERGAIAHSWNVTTETGGDLPHVWRVVRPELLILHGKDIQLPYGAGVVAPGG